MTITSVFNSFFVDFMSLKSKSALLWIAIIVAASVMNMKSIAFLFLIRVVSFLFTNDEKGVFATNFAPVNRKSMVYGRHMCALLSFTLCLAINLLADLVVPLFYSEYVQESSPVFYVLMFAVFSLLVAIEFPLLYWVGYAKIKVFEYIIFVGGVLLIVKVVGEEKIYNLVMSMNIGVQFTLPLIAAAIVLLCCSALISEKIYSRKDT